MNKEVSGIINESLKRALLNRKEENKNAPLHYLEIGVHRGETFTGVLENLDGVEVIKEGIDPYGPFDDGRIYRMTSQVFFALNEVFWKKTYDVIFIDALHFSPVLNQEIDESLKILNKYGMIILDDTVPLYEASGQVKAEPLVNWSKLVSYPLFHTYSDTNEENFIYYKDFPGFPEVKGDCWKSVIRIRMTRPDVRVGSALYISRPITLLCKDATQTLLSTVEPEDITWDYFQKNYNDILCPINSVYEMDINVK
jgi:hypothetical protein